MDYRSRQKKVVLSAVMVMFLWLFFLQPVSAVTQGAVDINATVVSICGNGIVNSGEQCDGSALAGQTCVFQGFAGGILSCTSACQFETSFCTHAVAATSGGGANSQSSVQSDSQIQPLAPKVVPMVYQKILDFYQEIIRFLALPSSPASVSSNSQPILETIVKNKASYIAAILPPEIIHYNSKLRVGDDLIIRGHTSYPNGKVQVFIAEQGSERLVINDTKADEHGDFTFTYKLPEKPASLGTAAIFDIFKRAYAIDVWTMTIDQEGNHGDIGKKLSISVSEPFVSLDTNALWPPLLAALMVLVLGYGILRYVKK